ncbi:MAG: autotransporter outer membrane beta-barrel domain-containing protein [Opitutales bacterium]|nr:autotransporter outer membrane beta-barrel domain-containing protein [Opitutales bacterium]
MKRNQSLAKLIIGTGIIASVPLLHANWAQDANGNWILTDTSTESMLVFENNATVQSTGVWNIGTEAVPFNNGGVLNFDGTDLSFATSGNTTIYALPGGGSAFTAIQGASSAAFNAGSSTEINVEGYDVRFLVGASDVTSLAGDIAVNLTTNANGNSLFTLFAQDLHLAPVSGSVTSNISIGEVSAADSFAATIYGLQSQGGSLTVDEVSGSIASTIGTESDITSNSAISLSSYGVSGYDGAYSIGDVSGSVTSAIELADVTAHHINSQVIALYGWSAESMSVGDVSGAISSSFTAGDFSLESTSGIYSLAVESSYRAETVTIGDVSGSITSQIEIGDLLGEIELNAAAIQTYEYDSSLTIGDITGSIASTIETGNYLKSTRSSNYNYSYGINTSDVTLGNIGENGSISATIHLGAADYAEIANSYIYNYGYAYGIDSETLSTGDIAGSISATATAAQIEENADVDNEINRYVRAYGIRSYESSLGNVSGTIFASAQSGSLQNDPDVDVTDNYVYSGARAYALYSSSTLDMQSFTGAITANASTAAASYDQTSGYISSEATALNGGVFTVDGAFSGDISATATVGNVSYNDPGDDYYVEADAYAIAFSAASFTAEAGISADSIISAEATTGNVTYVEGSAHDVGAEVYAYAFTSGAVIMGDMAGTISAVVTPGAGYSDADLSATGISSGSRGYDRMLMKSDVPSGSGAFTMGDLSGSVTVRIYADDLHIMPEIDSNSTVDSSAVGIAVGCGSVEVTEDAVTENSIETLSGTVDVNNTVGASTEGAYARYTVSTAGIIGQSVSSGPKRLALIAEPEEDPVYTGVDFRIGTLSGSVDVTSQIGEASGIVFNSVLGISGTLPTDGYTHDLQIDTLSGSVEVTSGLGVLSAMLVESDDIEVFEQGKALDAYPLNTVFGISNGVVSPDIIEYIERGYIEIEEGSVIGIDDFSGSLIVAADVLAFNLTPLNDYIADNEIDFVPDYKLVVTDIAGIKGNYADIEIGNMSGSITVSALAKTAAEGQDLHHGTVVVSGITAEENTVTIDNFTGSISVSGAINGEGKVVATGINAASVEGTLSGEISVASPDIAVGILLNTGEPQVLTLFGMAEPVAALTIDGTVSATGATGETYAIYSGYIDFDEEAEKASESASLFAGSISETINVTQNASFTGAIDLTGGVDTINLLNDSTDEGTFSATIANVENLVVKTGLWQLTGDYSSDIITVNGGTLHLTADFDAEGMAFASGTVWASAGSISNLADIIEGTSLRLTDTGNLATLVTLDGGTLDLQRSFAVTAENLDFVSGTVALNSDNTLQWGLATVSQGQSIELNDGLFQPTVDIAFEDGEFAWNAGDIDLNHFSLTGSEFTVPEGSLLYGEGTINGTVYNNGTIAPGYSPGTIVIDGDFVQSATGVLIMEIDGEDYDILDISGTATIAGALELDGELLNNYEYIVLDAEGGVTGEFSSISGSAMQRAEITYAPEDVTVILRHIPFLEFADNNSQLSVASSLEAIYETAPDGTYVRGLMDSVDDSETAAQVTDFLSQLAAPMAMNTGWLVEQTDDIMNMITGQQIQHPDGQYVWAKAAYGDISYDSILNYGERDGDYKGMIVGFSQSVGSGWSVGGAISGIDADLDNGASSTYENETTTFWLLADYFAPATSDGWNQAFRMGLGYGDTDITSSDYLRFNRQNITSDYDSSYYAGFIDFSIGRSYGAWTVEPSVGFNFQRVTDKEHTDSVGGSALRVWDKVTTKSVRSSLGLRASYAATSGDVSFVPYVFGYWDYQFEDEPEGTFTWAGTEESATLPAADWSSSTVRLGGGISARFADSWMANLSGDYRFSNARDAFGANIGLTYEF